MGPVFAELLVRAQFVDFRNTPITPVRLCPRLYVIISRRRYSKPHLLSMNDEYSGELLLDELLNYTVIQYTNKPSPAAPLEVTRVSPHLLRADEVYGQDLFHNSIDLPLDELLLWGQFVYDQVNIYFPDPFSAQQAGSELGVITDATPDVIYLTIAAGFVHDAEANTAEHDALRHYSRCMVSGSAPLLKSQAIEKSATISG
ncbi:hypothetical protein AB1N83_011669 [Pleurotus pulmonarius]